MKTSIGQHGFSNELLLVAVVVSVAIAGTFVAVYRASHHSSTANQISATSASSSQNKLNTHGQTLSGASPSQNSSASATSSSPATTSSTSKTAHTSTTSSNNTKTTSSSSTPASNNSSSTVPKPTPFTALVALITALDNGSQVDVSQYSVTVPGPISNATARPIVYDVNGVQYFAYKQGSAADFTTSPTATANTMAMTPVPAGGLSLVQAHLDKSGNLVDPNFVVVGYSTGGN